MLFFEEIKGDLADAAAHWNLIEKRLKEAEQITTEVITPAINELRYAGRQFVDAWAIFARDNFDGRACKERLMIAKQYMINADHDITDAVGLFLNIRISDVIQEFGSNFLRRQIPDFDEYDRKLAELQKVIATSRENRPLRVAEYKRAATVLIPDLLRLFELITLAEQFGIARDKRWQLINGACIAIGVIGSIASIISLVICWDQVRQFFHF